MNTLERNPDISQENNSLHAVKLTALSYIREAVAEEHYEEIGDMIAIAGEFGATPWDIRIALMPAIAA